MFPTNGISDMNSMRFHHEEYGVDKLLPVGSPGGLRSITLSHRPISVFTDKSDTLQDGPPKGSW